MPRTQLSRTPLSTQVGVVRTSLLLSLGLSPLACGGSAVVPSSAEGGSSSQAGAGNGAGAHAGAAPHAGAPSYGGHGGTGSTGGTSPVTACQNPTFDQTTKLVECENGLQHRAQALTCTFTVPPEDANGAAGEGGAANVPATCNSNEDCSALHYGYCEFGGDLVSVCRSGCTTDNECDTGQICACNGTNPGRCTTASCVTDADCGSGSWCAPAYGLCGPGSFECTTAQDQCATHADCGEGACVFDGKQRSCNFAVCGRPFLIAEAPRLAETEARADWLDLTLAPNPSALTPVQRAQLAAHWARLGQMEHASIAAFARFQLQLLSLGAPSDLVEACNHALADETAHARACFSLASAYGSLAIGPTQLDVQHCFEDTSLVAIAKLVLREGCLGETVASLEALAAAEVAADPAVRRTLTRIARDELEHAELAFKFLRWALRQTPTEVQYELAREAARQLADFESDARHRERTRSDDRLAAHGLLGGDALRSIHLAAVREVARPLLAALFEVETVRLT